MFINPSIKKTLKEIAAQAITYANSTDVSRRYYRRMLKIFKEQLSEDEQIFLMKTLFEALHYKHIVTDPDNVLQIHNVRMRTYLLIALLMAGLIILAAVVFSTNESLSDISAALANIMKMLSL